MVDRVCDVGVEVAQRIVRKGRKMDNGVTSSDVIRRDGADVPGLGVFGGAPRGKEQPSKKAMP